MNGASSLDHCSMGQYLEQRRSLVHYKLIRRLTIMKRVVLFVLILGVLFEGHVGAQVMEFGIKATPDGISEIGFVYSEYYRVQPAVVVDLERKRLSEDDMSVLLFISGRARVAPEVILRWRLAGDSWWMITERLRLDPMEIYYVPVSEHVQPGPPFGKAYGHFKAKRHSKLSDAFLKERRIAFDDDDIRNLVQLRLVSEYYGYPPEEIIKRRERGERFSRMIRYEHEKRHEKKNLKEKMREEKADKRHKKGHDHPDKGGRQ